MNEVVTLKRLFITFICFLFLHTLALSLSLGFIAGVLSAVLAIFPLFVLIPLIARLDPFEEEPIKFLVFAFVFGSVSAYLISYFGNMMAGEAVSHLVYRDMLTSNVLAPIIEEIAKFHVVVILFIFVRKEFNNVIDGIIYGLFAGLGLAFSENMLYYSQEYSHSGFSATFDVFVLRGFIMAMFHPLCTGILGASLFLTTKFKSIIIKILLVVSAFIFATVLHGLWNFTNGLSNLAMNGVYFGLYVPTVFCIIAISVYHNNIIKKMMKKQLHEFSDKEFKTLTSIFSTIYMSLTTLIKYGYKAYLARKKFREVAYKLASLRQKCYKYECNNIEGLQEAYCKCRYHIAVLESFVEQNSKNFFIGEIK